jgi:uncharacterized protein (DUF2384 family)
MCDARRKRLAEIDLRAEKVWGNSMAAQAFLDRQHPLLRGCTPREIAGQSEQGLKRVMRILCALAYGGPI